MPSISRFVLTRSVSMAVMALGAERHRAGRWKYDTIHVILSEIVTKNYVDGNWNHMCHD